MGEGGVEKKAAIYQETPAGGGSGLRYTLYVWSFEQIKPRFETKVVYPLCRYFFGAEKLCRVSWRFGVNCVKVSNMF